MRGTTSNTLYSPIRASTPTRSSMSSASARQSLVSGFAESQLAPRASTLTRAIKAQEKQRKRESLQLAAAAKNEAATGAKQNSPEPAASTPEKSLPVVQEKFESGSPQNTDSPRQDIDGRQGWSGAGTRASTGGTEEEPQALSPDPGARGQATRGKTATAFGSAGTPGAQRPTMHAGFKPQDTIVEIDEFDIGDERNSMQHLQPRTEGPSTLTRALDYLYPADGGGDLDVTPAATPRGQTRSGTTMQMPRGQTQTVSSAKITDMEMREPEQGAAAGRQRTVGKMQSNANLSRGKTQQTPLEDTPPARGSITPDSGFPQQQVGKSKTQGMRTQATMQNQEEYDSPPARENGGGLAPGRSRAPLNIMDDAQGGEEAPATAFQGIGGESTPRGTPRGNPRTRMVTSAPTMLEATDGLQDDVGPYAGGTANGKQYSQFTRDLESPRNESSTPRGQQINKQKTQEGLRNSARAPAAEGPRGQTPSRAVTSRAMTKEEMRYVGSPGADAEDGSSLGGASTPRGQTQNLGRSMTQREQPPPIVVLDPADFPDQGQTPSRAKTNIDNMFSSPPARESEDFSRSQAKTVARRRTEAQAGADHKRNPPWARGAQVGRSKTDVLKTESVDPTGSPPSPRTLDSRAKTQMNMRGDRTPRRSGLEGEDVSPRAIGGRKMSQGTPGRYPGRPQAPRRPEDVVETRVEYLAGRRKSFENSLRALDDRIPGQGGGSTPRGKPQPQKTLKTERAQDASWFDEGEGAEAMRAQRGRTQRGLMSDSETESSRSPSRSPGSPEGARAKSPEFGSPEVTASTADIGTSSLAGARGGGDNFAMTPSSSSFPPSPREMARSQGSQMKYGKDSVWNQAPRFDGFRNWRSKGEWRMHNGGGLSPAAKLKQQYDLELSSEGLYANGPTASGCSTPSGTPRGSPRSASMPAAARFNARTAFTDRAYRMLNERGGKELWWPEGQFDGNPVGEPINDQQWSFPAGLTSERVGDNKKNIPFMLKPEEQKKPDPSRYMSYDSTGTGNAIHKLFADDPTTRPEVAMEREALSRTLGRKGRASQRARSADAGAAGDYSPRLSKAQWLCEHTTAEKETQALSGRRHHNCDITGGVAAAIHEEPGKGDVQFKLAQRKCGQGHAHYHDTDPVLGAGYPVDKHKACKKFLNQYEKHEDRNVVTNEGMRLEDNLHPHSSPRRVRAGSVSPRQHRNDSTSFQNAHDEGRKAQQAMMEREARLQNDRKFADTCRYVQVVHSKNKEVMKSLHIRQSFGAAQALRWDA